MTGFMCKIKAGDFWWGNLLIYFMLLPSVWAAVTLGSCCHSPVIQWQLWPRSQQAYIHGTAPAQAALPACLGLELPLPGGSWASAEQPQLFSHWNAPSILEGCQLVCCCRPKLYPLQNESPQICCLGCTMHRGMGEVAWPAGFHKRADDEQKAAESGPRAAKGNSHPLGSQTRPKAMQPVLVLYWAGH